MNKGGLTFTFKLVRIVQTQFLPYILFFHVCLHVSAKYEEMSGSLRLHHCTKSDTNRFCQLCVYITCYPPLLDD